MFNPKPEEWLTFMRRKSGLQGRKSNTSEMGKGQYRTHKGNIVSKDKEEGETGEVLLGPYGSWQLPQSCTRFRSHCCSWPGRIRKQSLSCHSLVLQPYYWIHSTHIPMVVSPTLYPKLNNVSLPLTPESYI